ncbi:hypothetical protein CALVIDRAFT_551955 [Calocera viscosa TUFC12733]|uniref:Uncharacterized protein n=1 Tax=Calocera viscosa (strain TUFC12733) TaxID=1330018 RepID=A0A167S4J0_CALVF|nr:hypothetical protein CALVIDRAFT_551955 [Calocera viscosa TUFC12733]
MLSRPTAPRAFGSDQDLKRHLFTTPSHSYDMSDPTTLYEHGPAAVGPEVVGIGRGGSHSYHHSALSAMDPSPAKLRRVATLAYNSSSMDSRDSRPSALPSRWLVLVSAPSIVTEDGHLDTMSTSGPAGRESNGTLMPLHNTLFQQLSAIAKEFNFPSTAGLCCYIHYNEKGMSFAPRVTDDSWMVLWRRYLLPDDYSTSPQDFPVVGHIEFDVDVQKAKWYDAWLRAHRRMTAVPRTMTTSISSHPDQWEEEQYQDPPEATPMPDPAPKRLSLLDKRGVGSLSIQAVSRKQSIESSSRTMVEPAPRAEVLPTIMDHRFADANAEPPIPRDVNDRIRKWRDESAPASPANFLPGSEPYGFVDLATVEFQYEPPQELYPAAPTSDHLENDGEQEVEQELNLDDFTWSISSAGPPIDLSPPTTRRSSVVQDWQLEDPTMLTPSVIATSWGPPSPLDWPDSPSTGTVIYSPDLAWRMVETVPWSPTARLMSPHPSRIATTMGTDNTGGTMDASSPLPEEIRPVVWPYCDVPSFAAGSSRWAVGERHLYVQEPRRLATSQAYGFFDLYRAVYPHIDPYPALACAELSRPPPADPRHNPDNSPFGWPYMKATMGVEDAAAPRSATSTSAATTRQSTMWPSLVDAFAQGWPYTFGPKKISLAIESHYPVLTIYQSVYPYVEVYPSIPRKRTILPPSFSRVQYPHFDIYPATSSHMPTSRQTPPPVFVSETHYPSFDLYPPVRTAGSIIVALDSCYPFIEIYPPTYPHLRIYPNDVTSRSTANHRMWIAQNFTIYPDIVIYPDVSNARRPFADTKSGSGRVTPSSAQYPFLVIYSPVYPHIVPYPVPQPPMTARMTFDMDVSLWTLYPYSAQRAYVPVYPDNLAIYPEKDEYRRITGVASRKSAESGVRTAVQHRYPYFQIYATHYPHIEIYPVVEHAVRFAAEVPPLKVLIASKAPSPTAGPHHPPHLHDRVESPHRHRSMRSNQDIPPVPPLPVDVLEKYRSASSPITPPDRVSMSHLHINGNSIEEQTSEGSAVGDHGLNTTLVDGKRKWKHSHYDLHLQVFGSPEDSGTREHPSKRTSQVLATHDAWVDGTSPSAPRVHSLQPVARGRSGSILGRPPSMVPVGRLNLSKYGFA